MKNAIETKNLTKIYKNFTAVNSLNLEIPEKSIFGLLGPNGAGKTTLINMLSTQINPTSGKATINGLDLKNDSLEIRKIINISPQESAIAKNLTVRENLKLISTLYEIDNPEEKIEQIIDEFGLHEKENTLCKKLSGGQCRRLSIALAIITDPKILFLDEPTLGLDVKARKILWDIVEKLKHKMTIILTTHYLEEVQFLADSAAIISKGRIKVVGTIPEILASTNSNTLEEAFIKLSEEE